jgi:hypothetical protein
MAGLELVDSGVISINPNPGYQFSFACHSHLAHLGPEELLCTFQRGQALYSVDSVCVQMRSTDGGETWVEERLIHDPAEDERPYSYHGPTLTHVAGGLLVLTMIRWNRSDPAHPLFNEVTGGILPADTLQFKSTDGGRTWSQPQVVSLPEGMTITHSSPVVVLEDGQWFQAYDQWHHYDEAGPYRPRTVGLFSSDDGQSWGEPVIFAEVDDTGIGHWHGRIIRLQDDRLFTLFWTAQLSPWADRPLHYCIGSPDGRHWTNPEPTNIPGQTNWPVDFGNGRMVAIYTVRETQPPGFFATDSSDGGKSWDLDNQILVWDATGRDRIGVSAPDSYPRSHDTISYGAPTSIVLDNGDVFTTFWCTEMSVTHIRYARLRLIN